MVSAASGIGLRTNIHQAGPKYVPEMVHSYSKVTLVHLNSYSILGVVLRSILTNCQTVTHISCKIWVTFPVSSGFILLLLHDYKDRRILVTGTNVTFLSSPVGILTRFRCGPNLHTHPNRTFLVVYFSLEFLRIRKVRILHPARAWMPLKGSWSAWGLDSAFTE